MSGQKPTGPPGINQTLANAVLAIGTSEFIARAADYLRATVDFKGVFVTELTGRKQPVHV